MLEISKFALNRIISPEMNLKSFFKLANSLGFEKVELRNDLKIPGIIGINFPEMVKDLKDEYSIQILTINALQRFNIEAIAAEVLVELKDLVSTAKSIGCKAIVFCPDNNLLENQSEEDFYDQTLKSMKRLAPVLKDNGIDGYLEPLGFGSSSLRSILTAQKLILESNCSVYKIVIDTFHHFLSPDTLESLSTEYDMTHTGLVHISGVTANLNKDECTDDYRVLNDDKDILKSKEQLRTFLKMGYEGDISFEPFSPKIQNLNVRNLENAIKLSREYLQEI